MNRSVSRGARELFKDLVPESMPGTMKRGVGDVVVLLSLSKKENYKN